MWSLPLDVRGSESILCGGCSVAQLFAGQNIKRRCATSRQGYLQIVNSLLRATLRL